RLPLGPILIGQGVAHKLAFSPRGMLLATAGSPLAFSPDGRFLAVAGSGDITLWDMDPDSWITSALKMANRKLTPEERQRYLGE
nr:hypothetical protein [Desulfobacterales bacterium]